MSTPGSGSGSFRVAEDGTITGSVTTKDVQGTMAHIHRGAKGQERADHRSARQERRYLHRAKRAQAHEEQLEDLKKGNLYVNVHTNANKGGEVRGQLQP